MATISDLPDDLIVEVFSRVPLTSLGAVRCTCKRWNGITRCQILGKKAARKNQYLEFMIKDSKLFSLRLDLQGIRNEDEEDSVDASLKQISIADNVHHQYKIYKVYHCDGLLLCLLTKGYTARLVVWNPYMRQTKWIRLRKKYSIQYDRLVIGYEDKNKNRNYKILRIDDHSKKFTGVVDVYDFRSDSWKVVDVSPDVPRDDDGVSLKGNSYFFCQEIITLTKNNKEIKDYLLCFDFTRERFGPRLPPPPPYILPTINNHRYVTLSWVRDDKLAVLYLNYETADITEIWVSTRIDPNAVSWSMFLRLDMTLINGLPAYFSQELYARSFFIDEESKVVVLFGVETYTGSETRQLACIFGDGGYFKPVYLGLVEGSVQQYGRLLRSSYVLSLAQLQS